jgi:hypothetical protein
MPTITEKVEGDYQRQLKVDSVRAAALGMTVEKYRSEQAASVKRWAALMHEIMAQTGATDPMECLPEIVVAIERAAKGVARKTAEAAARVEVQRMLRRAMLP